jgi:hypothetical protein
MRSLFLAVLVATTALASTVRADEPPQIDFPGFLALTTEVSAFREQRLVDLNAFLDFAAAPDVLVLDARSREAFAAGHIDGAVNLPFSDFTDEKLLAVIGDPNRRILIYCNNNFSDDQPPVALKRAPLALNIPTFINLYGYGYRNLYELGDTVKTSDPRIRWTTS